ncbi:MAG: polyphosphate kinase 2 family protein [Verrucomicrobia bacterium]|nr:polyphosphate kinase 2 family protein [Verrucomicrobiota bacterium]
MKQPVKVVPPIRLKDFNPDFHEGLDKDATREKTTKLCQRISELQDLLYANARHAVLILLQGMDTSGKDGAAKRVLEFVEPAGLETANFKSPSAEELAHDFLWRIHPRVPRYGHIGVFNRSHYEDVLIVRVMKLQPERVWRPRYDQINAFEKHLVENRVILLKFFLHLSKAEQAERLRARLEDERKNWKFESADLEMRKRWPQFMRAYEDALNCCSTTWAPWHIVPADRKWYRDYVIARVVVGAMEKLKLKWPKPKVDMSKITIV